MSRLSRPRSSPSPTFVPAYPDWAWRSKPWDDGPAEWYARLFEQSVVLPSCWCSTPRSGASAAEARIARRQMDPMRHYARPDVFRLAADTAPKPAVTFGEG